MLFVAALVQSHLVLLLREAKVFAWLRTKLPLWGVWQCNYCTGFWVAGGLSILWTGWRSWLIIAAGGHLITLAREKYLPCNACTQAPTVPEGLTIHLPK